MISITVEYLVDIIIRQANKTIGLRRNISTEQLVTEGIESTDEEISLKNDILKEGIRALNQQILEKD